MARERNKNREESQAVEPQRGGAMSRRDPWTSFTPFGMMRRFADEMDRMFDDFGFPTTGFGRASMDRFSPQLDIFEREGKLVVRADLPGMTKDDINVDISEEAIVIEGERKYEHEQNEGGVYRSERSYGRFHREIPLPEGVKTDNATATFRNGVLEISIEVPKTAKNRRRIQIEGEDKERTGGQTAA